MGSYNRSCSEMCRRFPKMTEEEFASIRSCKERLLARLASLDKAHTLAKERSRVSNCPSVEMRAEEARTDSLSAVKRKALALKELLSYILALPPGSKERKGIETAIGMTTPEFIAQLVLLTSETSEWEEARRFCIERNLRLVASVAREYGAKMAENGYGYGDAFDSGVSGLLIAIDRFDPTRDVQFSTYALPWIKQCVALSLEEGSFIRVPSMKRRILMKKSIYENRSFMATGRNESLDLVEYCRLEDKNDSSSVKEVKNRIAKSKVAQRGLKDAFRATLAPDSLDASAASSGDENDEERSGAETFARDDKTKDPATSAQDAESSAQVFQALLTLCDRSRLIVVLRFGSSYSLDALQLTDYIKEQRLQNDEFENRLGDLVSRCGDCSFEEIGQLFGITRQRADQLFREALGALESGLRAA